MAALGANWRIYKEAVQINKYSIYEENKARICLNEFSISIKAIEMKKTIKASIIISQRSVNS